MGFRLILTLCLTVLLWSVTLPAAERAEGVPFVAGFDRFGRHGQLDDVMAGRLLLTELSCTACHLSDAVELSPKKGPDLGGIADRLSPQWIREFLLDPAQTKTGTTMPHVLSGIAAEEREGVVDSLLAFLGTQHRPWAEIKAGGANPLLHDYWEKGDASRGRRLYHQVGCVACHEPDETYEIAETKPSPLEELLEQLDPEEIEELGLAAAARPVASIPLPDLPAKYSLRSLSEFLLNPEQTRPAGRMPDLKLQPSEAADIAAWLLKLAPADAPRFAWAEQDVARIAEGKRVFAELRCANCHTLDKVATGPAKGLNEIELSAERTCYRDPAPTMPQYHLNPAQIQAVEAALRAIRIDAEVSPAAELQSVMLRLNCLACHERDGLGGVGRDRRPYFTTINNIDLGDEGRIPPPLTGVGRKLNPRWLKQVIIGDGEIRPYMFLRMPRFAAAAVSGLPDQLVRVDHVSGHVEQNAAQDHPGLMEAGRRLMDQGCVQCHLFRGEALPGVVGIDLAEISSRVRQEWFREFLLNPSELKPQTRMPSFFPGGSSQNRDILKGDPDRQIAAMWEYLRNIASQPLPDRIEEARSLDFELRPATQPIVLRTFMPQAGTRAIAVGFPEGVHLAFDAEQMRLAQAWKGRFLDAQGTWFSRFAPPTDPLGEEVVNFPEGVPLARMSIEGLSEQWPEDSADSLGYRFDGYRLDGSGTPTFLYRFGMIHVEDRIQPEGVSGLLRRLRLKAEGQLPSDRPLFFRVATGSRIEVEGTMFRSEAGLQVTVESSAGARRIRDQEGESWIVPVTVDPEALVEVHYSW